MASTSMKVRNLSKRLPIRGRGYSLASLACGPLDCRTYGLVCESTREAVLIDPSFASPTEFRCMMDHLRDREATLKTVLLTHAHPDHVVGIPETLNEWPTASLHLHSLEEENYAQAPRGGSEFGIHIHESSLPSPTDELRDGEIIEVGDNIELSVVHTPGHAPGHVAFVDARDVSECNHPGSKGDDANDQPKRSLTADSSGSVLISGDLLFAGGSIGRTDFPNSSMEDMSASLRRLYELFDKTSIVLSGHTTPTFLKKEQCTNPFVSISLRRPVEWYEEAQTRHSWRDNAILTIKG